MFAHSLSATDVTHLGYLANAISAMPDVKWDTFSNSMADILATQGINVKPVEGKSLMLNIHTA